ncbi:MAG: hypothetical protein ACM3JQ_02635, partial [Candidatus Eiseniibacteriota bacterium]
MVSDEISKSNKIHLNLNEAATKSGIIEIYIEDNTLVITVKISQLNSITERISVVKTWDRMVDRLTKKVKNRMFTKGITRTQINEIELQIINTLNQNFRLFRDRPDDESREREEENISQDDAQVLCQLASNQENTEFFFKNQYGEPYVAVRVGKDRHLETMPLQGNKYERYLFRLYCESTGGKIIGKDAVSRALNLLAANTIFNDNTIPLQIRVAWGKTENRARQDCIYYDMTDSHWRIVEISCDGWRIIDGSDTRVPILFKRYNQTQQVEPDSNYHPDIMENFLDLTNIKTARHRQLLKVYIISLLIPDIDHVILTTYGPKGAAKTFLLWLIKTLIDPSKT